uniref:4-hydroxy-2-oxohexanoate aldolase n=1 Tax=viral metagenome TaxID=1070528 RepID=A0A6C0HWZ7_9ZZZZ
MFHDLTLRDGSHAIAHQLTEEMIEEYCIFAEDAGIEVIEVGHGNGLGASSILIGESLLTDFDMITIAKRHLKKTKLSVHIIPGLATITRDIDPAIELGVDIFRIASHCTEASLTKTHIEYLVNKGKNVYGVLMMSASCSVETLYNEANKMKSYGAMAIIIMDSSGSYKPIDVSERIKALTKLELPIGFHGHNNLYLAVANSLAAIESGASIIDVTLRGFGAGAGNTPLEIMIFLQESKSIDKNKVLEYCDKFKLHTPLCKPINILTSKFKLFGGFEKHILTACAKYNISYIKLIEEIGKQELVAGQEDFIYIIANSLQSSQIS